MMKVLAVSLFSSRGAVLDGFRTLCSCLMKRLDLSVVTSSLFSLSGFNGELIKLKFSRFQSRTWLSTDWLKLIAFLRRQAFDVAFFYTENPFHLPISILLRNRPQVFWCFDPVPHSGGSSLIKTTHRVTKHLLLRNAAQIVVACEALRHDLLLNYGYSPQKVQVCYHGLLHNLIFPDLVTPERVDSDFIFFGRMVSYKGVDVLLEACRKLHQEGITFRLVLAGPGSLEEIVDKNLLAGLGGSLTVINRYLEDRELAELIQRSKIVVLPYRDATGTQTVHAAYYYRKPVIATAVGCFSEYVKDQVTGVIVPPESAEELFLAMKKLLLDSARRESMGQRGFEKLMSDFSDEILTNQLISIFEKALSGGNK